MTVNFLSPGPWPEVGGELTVLQGSERGFRVSEPMSLGIDEWPLSLLVTDMDGDGRLDLVCGTSSNNLTRHLAFFRSVGPREFEEPVHVPIEGRAAEG